MTRTTKIAVSESEQGYLGIQLQNIDESMAKMYGMPQGVYVYKIMEDSAAAGSDLHEKDIITKLDGEKISNYADLAKLLTYYKSGDTVNIDCPVSCKRQLSGERSPVNLKAASG